MSCGECLGTGYTPDCDSQDVADMFCFLHQVKPAVEPPLPRYGGRLMLLVSSIPLLLATVCAGWWLPLETRLLCFSTCLDPCCNVTQLQDTHWSVHHLWTDDVPPLVVGKNISTWHIVCSSLVGLAADTWSCLGSLC